MKEVYVVVTMFKGCIDDVAIYQNDPRESSGFKFEEPDEFHDNGTVIYITAIK